MRKPRLFASPPRPRSPRSLSRPEKLISVVSCATTTRRPRQACAVRAAASSKIAGALTRSDPRKRCAAISAARSAPNWRGAREPELVISSSIRSNLRTIRMSPQNPAILASRFRKALESRCIQTIKPRSTRLCECRRPPPREGIRLRSLSFSQGHPSQRIRVRGVKRRWPPRLGLRLSASSGW
jgi:hypothetical protein